MVGLVDDFFKKYPISSRIKVSDDYGTVRYVGEVKGYQGTWVGVEWDDPKRGKHDGMTNGIRYFQTSHPTSGSMIRPGKIEPFETLEEAINVRYIAQSDNPLDEDLVQEAKKSMRASLFQIVGMEKIAKKQGRVEELAEVSVSFSTVNSPGLLAAFSSLQDLNLTATLVWNWQIVAGITRQVPTLQYLNLSSNRLVPPTESNIQELQQDFRNVKHINLRKCGLSDWEQILLISRMWPDVEYLGLQENDIEKIVPADCNNVFRNLRELYMPLNKISSFKEICKLGNIKTLQSLYIMENQIKSIELPDCDYNEKLSMFPSLELLQLYDNPLSDDCSVFNELDKLPALNNLSMAPRTKSGYEEMFSKAVALISQLKKINKAEITDEERRGAEYDIWKQFGLEWQQSENNFQARKDFCKRYRTYSNLVKKYGSPEEFIVRPAKKLSNLVKIRILNTTTGECFEKKVPRKMSLQAFQGLIMKHFKIAMDLPKLSYVDADHPNLIVPLDNLSKNLDYYSIQDGDTVHVEEQ